MTERHGIPQFRFGGGFLAVQAPPLPDQRTNPPRFSSATLTARSRTPSHPCAVPHSRVYILDTHTFTELKTL